MLTPRHLLDHLPDNPVVLEAGAHHGEDTVALAVNAAHVYAFEPVPELHEVTERVTRHCGNVTLSRLALGGEEAMGWMHVSSGAHDASSSLMAPAEHATYYPTIGFKPEPIAVVVTTIETWAKTNHIDHIDGMWLDMQGGELQALKAAGTILQHVRAIMLEISTVELYHGAPLWPEVRLWLANHGFQVAIEDLYSEHAGDALVVRASHTE
jgi:FkbM family methyltransferase